MSAGTGPASYFGYDQQTANSKCLTAYYIAFGPHGPRALPPPDENKKVVIGIFVGICASLVVFGTMRMFAKPGPHTMNKEWQEAANEYLKVRSQTRVPPLPRMLSPAGLLC